MGLLSRSSITSLCSVPNDPEGGEAQKKIAKFGAEGFRERLIIFFSGSCECRRSKQQTFTKKP